MSHAGHRSSPTIKGSPHTCVRAVGVCFQFIFLFLIRFDFNLQPAGLSECDGGFAVQIRRHCESNGTH